ncbi:family 43 glycosylhydrolase [Paenibacillus arenilitoris]|uniref:Family 43 glycosylhydrolase n=1 Tax=Paenibacillus arenilitoris TaxID=2772299 RepID=A0A927H9P2_9BACL|nr:family 43 glycosylhydrolase [Paenibacillus arenilitoris]MBD2872943.1 family 43 glycosylhydrolase [Paenibacillus arenilitoris]
MRIAIGFKLTALVLLIMLTLTSIGAYGSSAASTLNYSNPINTAGADPYIMLHSDGYYYFTRTLGNRLDIWKSRSLIAIDLGERKTIWTPPSGLKDIWAPEIHNIGGKWYIYYTANTGCGDDCRGIYVLENDSADPLQGDWTDKGKMNLPYSGLDGTVFDHNGQLYFLYAAYGDWSGSHGSAIAIAMMSNPWTLDGDNVILTKPEYSWEKKGMPVNEGAVILKRNGKIFLVYSASACWEDDYSLGILTADDTSDLLNPASWTKSEQPVFAKSPENGVYGPGHNSFVQSKDGTQDLIVYHGNSGPGQGCGPRPTRVQPFTWMNDGSPNFGIPTNGPLAVPSGDYRIEAEHGVPVKAQIKEKKGASGGKIVRLNNSNSSLTIKDVIVPEEGSYTLNVRYSGAAGPKASVNVSVNGKPALLMALPRIGSNQYATAAIQVELKKGYNNLIEFTKGKHAVEIDSIELAGSHTFSVKPGAEYKLINPYGGKALDVADAGMADGTWTQMSDDSNGTAAQRWKIALNEDGTYTIINPNSGKALTVLDPAEAWGRVGITENQGLDTQKWKLIDTGNGYCKLINVQTGKALDVSGASINSGAGVGTWKDLPGGVAQLWLFYRLD